MNQTYDPNSQNPEIGNPQNGNPQSSGVPVGGQAGSGQTGISNTTEFDIPAVVQEKYADLVALILETKSMDDKERQYWFHILPVMNQDQVDKLNTILNNEKQKLAEIQTKYGQPAAATPESTYTPIDEEALKQKMENIKNLEAENNKSEAAKEAALLAELENL